MTVNEQIVLHCALRYALGRQTYVVAAVVQTVLDHWDELQPFKIADFVREIQQAALEKPFEPTDAREWNRIVERWLNTKAADARSALRRG